MMKRLVSCIVLVIMVLGCAEQNPECTICGSYSLQNFSKNEIFRSEEDNVSIRRNLTLNEYSGSDFYTIWSWDEQKPASSWTENVQKNVVVKEHKFTLNTDNTWEWLIVTEENFESSPSYGVNTFLITRRYQEKGSWEYANAPQNIVHLSRLEKKVENSVNVTDKENWEKLAKHYPFSRHTKLSYGDEHRCFHITRDEEQEKMILSTMEDDKNVYEKDIHTSGYSVTEGNIFMALTPLAGDKGLALKAGKLNDSSKDIMTKTQSNDQEQY